VFRGEVGVSHRHGERGVPEDSARVPRVQMRDTRDALEVRAEMPGIEGRNVSLMFEDDVLTITGE
jgi:HSP20 family molecular chaperone IbpA